MILDQNTVFSCSVPTAGNLFTNSTFADLQPNASGSGPYSPIAPMIGEGEPLIMQFRIETAFLTTASAAFANFHVLLSDQAAPTTNTLLIGSSCGQLKVNTSFWFGYEVAQLQVIGSTINVYINDYQSIMSLGGLSLAAFRYLGIGISCVNYSQASTNFTAGSVSARLVRNVQRTEPRNYTSLFKVI